MKGDWAYFGGYFSKETCQKILDLGLKIPQQEATLGVDGTTVDNNMIHHIKVNIKNTMMFFGLIKTTIIAN